MERLKIIEGFHDFSRPDLGFGANVLVEDVVPRLELGVDRSVKDAKISKITNRRLAKALGWHQHCLYICAINPTKVTLSMLRLSASHTSTHNGYAFPR